MNSIIRLSALIASVVAVPTFAADTATSAPKPIAVLAAPCAACHGADGNATAPNYPKLAGQYHDYLAQALHEYKDGQRTNPIMAGFAKTLTDREIDRLSRHFASLPGKLDDLSHHEQGD